ncbi:hypothetical protein CEXT_815201 [Caerostris extrusa]|uniref:RRM domain-containing protein n=1 Tax=Caerostris extrusa TaxID=172846 RepID=A0AAV4UF87_CAEEX|nr:hypothetical protein CEXT_815201 [Caerostris extrusa]
MFYMYYIRLQNLPLSAGIKDVRHFFSGIDIPEGHVQIIGGERGDVFIGFRSYVDASQAMLKNGGNS